MRNVGQFFLIILAFAFFSACNDPVDCDCDAPLDLRSITAEEAMAIEAANDFSFDIFARINEIEAEKNLFISPLSISTALSMTANGAMGSTNEGITTTLHQNDATNAEINEAYKTLVDFLTNLDPKVTMRLANSNWYK